MFVLIVIGLVQAAVSTVVETEYGPVRGHIQDADLGKQYLSFRGVPYSKQAIGDLRFKPLEAPEPWKEIFDAREEVPICPQRLKYFSPTYLQNQPMSEACLGANIYVPIVRESDELLPVLVYFYGSGFSFLSSNTDLYGPEYLVARDIIVVTVNLRQSIFGFLTLGTTDVPGNGGIKDAYFFLQWIQRNIEAFGGDPEKVTAGGQSAGAATVHLLTLYPPAEGLFRSVIMQSGNGLASWVNTETAYHTALNSALYSLLNITTDDTTEIYDILKNADEDTLRIASDALIDEYVLVSFCPTIEIEANDAILTADPTELMNAKQFIDVPQLIGYTTDECLAAYFRLKDIDFISRLKASPASALVPTNLALKASTEEQEVIYSTLNETYFEPHDDDAELFDHYLNLCEDSLFAYPTLRYARWSALNKKAPTYLFQFSFDGKNNLISKVVAESPRSGAGHIDDINYLFKANFYDGLSESMAEGSIEELTKNRMADMWANFVKTGNPTPDITEEIPVQWCETDAETLTYLDINNELTIKTNPLPEVIELYDQFYTDLD